MVKIAQLCKNTQNSVITRFERVRFMTGESYLDLKKKLYEKERERLTGEETGPSRPAQGLRFYSEGGGSHRRALSRAVAWTDSSSDWTPLAVYGGQTGAGPGESRADNSKQSGMFLNRVSLGKALHLLCLSLPHL